jgi:hypothetical protein
MAFFRETQSEPETGEMNRGDDESHAAIVRDERKIVTVADSASAHAVPMRASVWSVHLGLPSTITYTIRTMSRLLRGLAAGYGAKKMGGGCFSTVLIFILLWWLLGHFGIFR